jgi:hypothetical protein
MKNKWLRPLFYCLVCSISLLIEVFNPGVKTLFCTPLPVREIGDLDSSKSVERSPLNQHSPDREK